jgi:hypothetical protein
MYWQVYLHKTVLSAEMMLVNIIRRAKELINEGVQVPTATEAFGFFLQNQNTDSLIEENLDIFCRLDDVDVMCTIKNWCAHPDKVLSLLCQLLVDRKLLKIKLQNDPFADDVIYEMKLDAMRKLNISEKEAGYLVFKGETSNTTYNLADENINILFKDGTVKDISAIDNALIHRHLNSTIKKYYICSTRV